VNNVLTYKLVTGADTYDPYRKSGPGRGYGTGIYHYYVTDSIDCCSGEVLGSGSLPPQSQIGEYGKVGNFSITA
jgi:hypothetical protein